uniref:Uncharacterized protein n=1 Tax=Arundo donax TaxID=35708 RepID=A0A0A9B4A6_ARUDO
MELAIFRPVSSVVPFLSGPCTSGPQQYQQHVLLQLWDPIAHDHAFLHFCLARETKLHR